MTTAYTVDNERYEAIEDSDSTGDWEQVASFVSTFASDNEIGEGACDVSVDVLGSDDAGYILRTTDGAGGDNDLRGYVFEAEDAAREFAGEYAAEHDEASGKGAETYLDGRYQDEAAEDAEGEYSVWWETVGDDAHIITRHATLDAAKAAAAIRSKALRESHPGQLLCGYGVRQLEGGEWIEANE